MSLELDQCRQENPTGNVEEVTCVEQSLLDCFYYFTSLPLSISISGPLSMVVKCLFLIKFRSGLKYLIVKLL